MNIVIVGGGVMGLAAAWALARSGHGVTLLDQGPIPNPLASSSDEHRLIRYAYGAAAGYTRMVDDAHAAWDLMWGDLGRRLYVPTGTLALASSAGRWVRQSAETLERQGREVRWLTRAELQRDFPLLRCDDVAEGFLLESGGVLLADRILEALARHLAAAGVRLRPHARACAIDPDRARVTLEGGEIVGADALVVAAGAWLPRLLPRMGKRLVPSRQVVTYVEPPDGLAARWSVAPMLLDLAPDAGFYLVPPVAGTAMKLGDHRFSLTGDPDDERRVDAAELEPVYAAARRRLRDFDRFRQLRLKVCFYTVEPEERFVVEPLGPAAWLMSPCSGHGFKFAAALGEALAAEIVGDAPPGRDLARWAAGFAA
jgi:glycine/D-amino acid oxidase-like deaminating enzyme